MFRRQVSLLTVILAMAVSLPAFADRTPINFGDNLSGRFLCNGSVDSLVFTGTAGDRIVAFVNLCYDIGGSCSPYCCCFDLSAEIRDVAGTLEASNASGLNGNNCGIQLRLPIVDVRLVSTGEHNLSIHDVDYHGGGATSIFLQRVSNPGGQYETLSQGDVWLKTIGACGTVHTYVFTGGEADSVSITMTPYGGSGVIDPRLELYDPQGRALSKPGNGIITKQRLPASGQYVLLAYSALSETGDYQLVFNNQVTAVIPTTWGRVKMLYR